MLSGSPCTLLLFAMGLITFTVGFVYTGVCFVLIVLEVEHKSLYMISQFSTIELQS